MTTDIKEYNKDAEDLFIQFLYSDPETFVRVKNIISPSFFENLDNKKVVEFLLEYTNKQSSLPTLDQVRTVAGTTINPIDGIDDEAVKWFMGEFETFCQQKAAKEAVYDSMALIDENNLSEVVDRLKKASELAIVKDLGINYFDSPVERLKKMRDNSKMISTGWTSIDKKLYGGLEKGTLTIWAGQSGAGKSLFLQNQALNWAEAGLNAIYITLELSESLTSMRIDAMTSGYSTKEIMKNIDDVGLRVNTFQKKCKSGTLQIKQLPNGSTANDIRAYIKEYEIQTKRKVDAVLVDYLDLCAPLDKRVSPSDMFVKDKYVSEELRNLAVDLDLLMVTASQLNRGSHDEIEFSHAHIAGGISKINTADNVIAIFTTISMKESGRYQIQFMKTRSSAGVGSKVDLKFNIASLRILDLEEGEADAVTSTADNILGSLKKSNIVTDIQETEGEKASRSGAAVKQGAKGLRDLVKNRNI
jgi:KaiC/GvpD/RAD55 family RecA-like ATPase